MLATVNVVVPAAVAVVVYPNNKLLIDELAFESRDITVLAVAALVYDRPHVGTPVPPDNSKLPAVPAAEYPSVEALAP